MRLVDGLGDVEKVSWSHESSPSKANWHTGEQNGVSKKETVMRKKEEGKEGKGSALY